MTNPPSIIPVKQRHGRKRRENASPPTPASAPVLVSAVYSDSGLSVTLVFDRAVEVVAFEPSFITVQDQINEWLLESESWWTVIDPFTLELSLLQIGSVSGSEVLLNASAGTGIVSVDGALAWEGVSDLVLPFS